MNKLLSRCCWLIVFAILFLTALAYPLKLKDEWVTGLQQYFTEKGFSQFWFKQLEPLLYFGHAPLVLKEVIADVLILFLLICFILKKAVEKKAVGEKKYQHVVLMFFVFFAGLSIFYSPTFYYSLRTFVNLCLFALFFIIVEDLARDVKMVYRSLFLVLLCSAIIALVALAQHLGLTDSFLVRFEDIRNRMGSFIGHNTGLSMFLYPALFISLGLSLVERRWPLRWLLRLFLVLLAMVYVLAQSRGAWLVLMLLLPLFLWSLKETIGFRVRLRPILLGVIVILLILLSQIIDNPLKVKEMPFQVRLRSLKPTALAADTRFRVPVCSWPLIKKSPLGGYGLGSFQYVYPRAQGTYFKEHPYTIIVPTGRRTQRAHNEYLQTTVELGIVGLIMALVALYIYLRRGWLHLDGLRDKRQRATKLGILFAAVAVLLQAFVDFPFHITPVGLYFCFMLALWISPFQLEKQISKKARPHDKSHLKQRWVLIVAALILLAVTPLFSWFVYLRAYADVHYNTADSFVKTFYEYEEKIPHQAKIYLLNNAKKWISAAVRVEPMFGLNLFKRAEITHQLGRITAEQVNRPDERVAALQLEKERQRSLLHLQNARFWLWESLNSLRFHSSFYLLGLIYQEMYELYGRWSWFSKAVRHYQTAIEYSPAYAPALHQLAELYTKGKTVEPERITKLRRQIARYDPEFYESHYISKIAQKAHQGDFKGLVTVCQNLINITPDRPELYWHLYYTYLIMNDAESARQVVELMIGRFPQAAATERVKLSYYLRNRQYEKAYAFLSAIKPEEGKEPSIHYLTFETYLFMKSGKKEAAEAKLKLLQQNIARHPNYLSDVGTIIMFHFADYEEGAKYLKKRCTLEPPPGASAFYFVARYLLENKQYDEAGDYITKGLQINPRHIGLTRLNQRWERETKGKK